MKRLRHIIPHIHRTWRLSITLRTRLLGTTLLSSFRDLAAPNLQHLEIVYINWKSSHLNCRVEMFSRGAPRLTFVKMGGYTPFPVPPWTATLTIMEFRRGRASMVEADLVAITTQCPSLVHLYLDTSQLSVGRSQFHIPTLKSLHISVEVVQEGSSLLDIVDFFDTPALTEFRIDGAHGEQIFALFNSTSPPHVSFPALNSLCFANNTSTWCSCGIVPFGSDTNSFPPLHLFPALSSLSLIEQCSTSKLVKHLLGPTSQPWPLLKTLTLCPKNYLKEVRDAIQEVIHSKRQHGHPLPKFRLSSALLSKKGWGGNGADLEFFDPATNGVTRA
ncbi:hypothetical protein B0H19DRAFT_1098608 [Mycena capillaripes]|nr:hypothetical protein B0H19DRAFT_1098608 [Mycena capillaripes]